MRIGRGMALLALAIGAAGAGPLTDRSTDDDVLDAMHDRGGDLKSFTADVTQVQANMVQPGVVTYRGRAAYQVVSAAESRMHLTLDTKQKEKGPVVASKKEYLLEKGWLTDRDYPSTIENRRQLVRPGQSVDLFSLGKGAFPLPIGQDRAKVRQLFDVSRPKPDPEFPDPPHTIHLKLVPKPETDLARQFKSIEFWVDTERRMPVRIETVDAKESMDQTTDLTNLTVNPPVGDADFALPAVKDWKVDYKPLP